VRRFNIPGVGLGLIDGGKVVFEGDLVVKTLGKPDPVDADTLFLAAANAKAMTTLLLASAHESLIRNALGNAQGGRRLLEGGAGFNNSVIGSIPVTRENYIAHDWAGISLKDWGSEHEAELPRGTPRLDSEGMALARCPTLCPVGAALDGSLFILGGDKPVLPPARQAGRCRDRARHRSADHSEPSEKVRRVCGAIKTGRRDSTDEETVREALQRLR
jgi:hypothetical protein